MTGIVKNPTILHFQARLGADFQHAVDTFPAFPDYTIFEDNFG
jgi:hypothetical protein